MMRNWPTRARIAPAGRRQRNLKTATHDVSDAGRVPAATTKSGAHAKKEPLAHGSQSGQSA